MLGILELQLEVVVSHCVGAGISTWVLLKRSKYFYCWAIFPAVLHFLKLASPSTPHCHPTTLTHICILIGTFFWLSFILFIYFFFRKGLCIYNSFSFEQNSMKSTELLCSCLCLPQGHYPPELSVHLCSWVNTVILDLRIHCWSPSNGSGQ